MQTKPALKPDTIRIRVAAPVKAWLRSEAIKRHVDMSDIIRPMIMDQYAKHYAKR